MARAKITRHDKLVRDGIPDKIRRNGEIPKTRILSPFEKSHQLLVKIVEESKEALAEEDTVKQIVELTDVQEAIDEFLRVRGVSWEEFRKLQAAKRRQVGGFQFGTFLETTQKA